MAYNRRKRKVKKNIPKAQAHISCSYNNTLVTITDEAGNTISWASSGTIGYKGSKKKTPYAAGLAAESAGKEDQLLKYCRKILSGVQRILFIPRTPDHHTNAIMTLPVPL